MEVFSKRTANDAWLCAARALRDRGGAAESRGGQTRELLHAALVVAEPRERWIVSRLPAMNPAFALAEVVWILAGRADARFVAHWNPGLSKFVGPEPELHGAYGKRLRNYHGIDQLELAFETLRRNPTSRQVVLQIWSASLDLPNSQGLPRSQDIPCNISSCLKVRDGALHWLQTLRSNDIFLGVPHNMVQFTTLQEIVAGWLGIDVGEYVQVCDSLHLYDRDESSMSIDEHIAPAPNADRFRDGFVESARRIAAVAFLMDTIITGSRDERSAAYSRGLDLPPEYANMFAVISADDCRRRGQVSLAAELMGRCTNPVYRQLWERWCERKAGAEEGGKTPRRS